MKGCGEFPALAKRCWTHLEKLLALPWQQHGGRWGAGFEVVVRGPKALEKPKVSLQAALIRHIQLSKKLGM